MQPRILQEVQPKQEQDSAVIDATRMIQALRGKGCVAQRLRFHLEKAVFLPVAKLHLQGELSSVDPPRREQRCGHAALPSSDKARHVGQADK